MTRLCRRFKCAPGGIVLLFSLLNASASFRPYLAPKEIINDVSSPLINLRKLRRFVRIHRSMNEFYVKRTLLGRNGIQIAFMHFTITIFKLVVVSFAARASFSKVSMIAVINNPLRFFLVQRNSNGLKAQRLHFAS